MNQYTDYTAQKPWEGTQDRFGIRDTIVNGAIKNKTLLRIFYQDKVCICDPKWWRKTSEKIFRVYKYPDEPMRLFVNTAKWQKPKTERELYLESQGIAY